MENHISYIHIQIHRVEFSFFPSPPPSAVTSGPSFLARKYIPECWTKRVDILARIFNQFSDLAEKTQNFGSRNLYQGIYNLAYIYESSFFSLSFFLRYFRSIVARAQQK